jgi:hypothetical protein
MNLHAITSVLFGLCAVVTFIMSRVEDDEAKAESLYLRSLILTVLMFVSFK